MKRDDIAAVFAGIYRRNGFGGSESISGPGSCIAAAQRVIDALPALLATCEARTLLDIPCGDFWWMRKVNLGAVMYSGADIVPAIIARATLDYARPGVKFAVLNLIADDLPMADVVLCRDCLVHLSFDDARRALANLVRSKSRYLLTTTFTERTVNKDIKTGQWYPINLELEPFRLPAPMLLLNEGCTEEAGAFRDKSLGLWLMSDVGAVLDGKAQ